MAKPSGWTDFSVTGTLNQLTNLFGTVVSPVARPIETFLGVEETKYGHSEDRFPDDLGTSQNSHVLKIMATQANGDQAYTAYLHIPGSQGDGGSPIIFDQQHNFADIRLTNIINDSLLGVGATMMTKKQLIPAVQVLYRSTNLRQFDFNFLLAPRSEKESQSIENIAKNLRMFAAPEFKDWAAIVPGTFEFKFMRSYNGDMYENTHLPKIAKCAVTKVTLNYAPTGTWSAFRNGYPMAVLMTISATEIEVIDRNKIKDGY